MAEEQTPPAPPAQPATDTSRPQSDPRTFPCEGCGADFEFSIDAQKLECPYCGHVKELALQEDKAVEEQDLRAMLDQQSGRRELSGDQAQMQEVGCRDCGAKVQFLGTLTSQDCPYCGTPIQLSGVHDAGDRIPVDGVLPFRVDKDKARTNLSEWVSSRWFAPNSFKEKGVKGKFAGVYMPFWTFDAATDNHYSGERGEHYYVTVKRGEEEVREQRTRWYPASGQFRRFFDDILVHAARGLPDKVMQRLEPWPLSGCKPFNAELLSGFLARTYEVELKSGFKTAEKRMERILEQIAREHIGGDTQRLHSVQTSYGALSYKHLLLPVWMLAYKYGEKSYQVVVNAATGEVQGERPYSWIKITLFVLLIGGLIATGVVLFR